jgi:excisionase family DNA binding protein
MQPARQPPLTAWLITVKQAAQILSVSTRTVNYLIADGNLPSVKIGGARRIWLDELLNWARSSTDN